MTAIQEADLWADYFDGGSFLLAGAAESLGLAEDVDHDVAAGEAWHRLGAVFLKEGRRHHFGRNEGGHGRWALTEFGRPPNAD